MNRNMSSIQIEAQRIKSRCSSAGRDKRKGVKRPARLPKAHGRTRGETPGGVIAGLPPKSPFPSSDVGHCLSRSKMNAVSIASDRRQGLYTDGQRLQLPCPIRFSFQEGFAINVRAANNKAVPALTPRIDCHFFERSRVALLNGLPSRRLAARSSWSRGT